MQCCCCLALVLGSILPPGFELGQRGLGVGHDLKCELHYYAGKFLFALCEGNFCTGGKKGEEPGNGRIIIAQFEAEPDNESNCK